MAISGNHYRLLKEHAPLFKRGGALLEIGEANWYGDVDPSVLFDYSDIAWARICGHKPDAFTITKYAYRLLFDPSTIEAVDMGGTRAAMRQDLNGLLKLPRRYDVVINHGTAEHVFSIAQVFYSMHYATLPGGYMVHDAPLTCFDHGFFNLNPTLFYDLAAANGYEIVSVSVYWIGGKILRFETHEQFHGKSFEPNAMLYVVYRKPHDKPFVIPTQGVYAGTLSEAGQQAWRDNR
jgi:SAM-dependent methyltransferase